MASVLYSHIWVQISLMSVKRMYNKHGLSFSHNGRRYFEFYLINDSLRDAACKMWNTRAGCWADFSITMGRRFQVGLSIEWFKKSSPRTVERSIHYERSRSRFSMFQTIQLNFIQFFASPTWANLGTVLSLYEYLRAGLLSPSPDTQIHPFNCWEYETSVSLLNYYRTNNRPFLHLTLVDHNASGVSCLPEELVHEKSNKVTENCLIDDTVQSSSQLDKPIATVFQGYLSGNLPFCDRDPSLTDLR